MRIAIHQPQYMPWSGYFHKVASVDLFVYLDDVQFKKNEWQHRNRLRGPGGPLWFSVPTTYTFPQTINQVAIDQSANWRKKHLACLQTCYGKSPCFAALWPQFNAFFQQNWTTIDQLNIDSIELLAAMIGITTKRVRTSTYSFSGTASQRLVTICKHFGATTYLAGVGGHDYMDLSLFEEAGIKVEFQHYRCPSYPQRFSATDQEFIPNLSLIDMLFNCGSQSRNLLLGKAGEQGI